MSVQTQLNKEFDSVATFASAAEAGVQEDLNPIRDSIAALNSTVQQLSSRVSALEATVAALRASIPQ